ncbi:unnamed protein product [Rotaria socialis]|uniref:Helix-turn-helix domain-containing protein n=1 Tax=Rotaria socialis TaxID=392032 RepID=A0A819A1L2_9BILA|nr:unnamed protein product [Rotaria socialis]
MGKSKKVHTFVHTEGKVAEYRRDTNAYEELSYNPLEELITHVTSALNELKEKKQLSAYRYNLLVPNSNTVKQSYLYFNPKAHKEGTPLRPIMNTIGAVTRAISELLDELIRPIYYEHTKDNTIVDSVNLIKRLEAYADDGRLQPTTLFGTFDITNLFTMLPQDESIKILGIFLRKYVGEYIKGISVTTIQKLAEIVVKQNAFVCNNKFYKQIIGGAMGSPFTLTLANIFMWHWEQRWIRRQDANQWHPNIKLQAHIDTSVPFLDVLVSNYQGALHTAVYHKPSAEPYVVPFLSDHPRHTFPNIIQTALVRAIRYSSMFATFTDEQISIELMLLYNGLILYFTLDSFIFFS